MPSKVNTFEQMIVETNKRIDRGEKVGFDRIGWTHDKILEFYKNFMNNQHAK